MHPNNTFVYINFNLKIFSDTNRRQCRRPVPPVHHNHPEGEEAAAAIGTRPRLPIPARHRADPATATARDGATTTGVGVAVRLTAAPEAETAAAGHPIKSQHKAKGTSDWIIFFNLKECYFI